MLTDLTATGPRDAGAVAQLGDAPASGALLVLHWDGLRWRPLPELPRPARSAQNAFIGASAASDAWVLAQLGHGAEALHWDGARWSVSRAPACGQVFPAVLGPRRVWAFADGYRACAARFDGRAWHTIAMPGVPYAVSALSPGDIWATRPTAATAPRSPGPSLTRPVYVAMHRNGHRWHVVPLSALPLGPGQHLFGGAITATGPGDVWIDYGIQAQGSNISTELLLHWNGRAWHRFRVPPSYGVWSIASDGRSGLWLTAQGSAPDGERWYFYHLSRNRLSVVAAPARRGSAQLFGPAQLARIPGTASLWGIEDISSPAGGSQGAILRYTG